MLNNKYKMGGMLISVVLGLTLLGVGTTFIMRQGQYRNRISYLIENEADIIRFESFLKMILNDEKFCRVSLAGEGPWGNPSNPVKFFKQDIDGDVDGEGLDVELYLSDKDGENRTDLKLSTNPGSNSYGHIKVQSIKLLMNKTNTGSNYPDSLAHNDVGELQIEAIKKISNDKSRPISMKFDVFVEMRTGQSGTSEETTLISCRTAHPEALSLPIDKGCANKDTWYCHCVDDRVASRFMQLTACIYCNPDGYFETLWLGNMKSRRVSSSSVKCSNSGPSLSPGTVLYYKNNESPP